MLPNFHHRINDRHNIKLIDKNLRFLFSQVKCSGYEVFLIIVKKYRFYYLSYLQLLLSPIKISFKPRITLLTISCASKRSARQLSNCFQCRLCDSGNKLQSYSRIHLVFQTQITLRLLRGIICHAIHVAGGSPVESSSF